MLQIGTDIKDGKCSWLALQALEMSRERVPLPAECSISPLGAGEVMKQHYGKPSAASVQAVQDLFDQLQLRSFYSEYSERVHEQLISASRDVLGVSPEAFLQLLRKIHRRNQ